MNEPVIYIGNPTENLHYGLTGLCIPTSNELYYFYPDDCSKRFLVNRGDFYHPCDWISNGWEPIPADFYNGKPAWA